MNTVIPEFQGKYRFLSNFWPAEFKWDDIIWSSSEHAYQAAKSIDHEFRLAVSRVSNPGNVKRIGKGQPFTERILDKSTGKVSIAYYSLSLRPDWEQVKIATMGEIVLAKFIQNEDLAQKLLETGDAILEEGNRWNDRFWGICPPGSHNGRNELGHILRQVRTILAEKTAGF